MAIILALLHVWAHRNDVSPDSISYIEIAWASARVGLHQIVNAYWSPLYPFLMSLVFRFFHPLPQWEFTAVHFLNFVVYLASLATFELFLRELMLARRTAGESSEKSSLVPPRTVWTWGYVFFLWASYFWLGAAVVTPDLCVAVIVYLTTALLLRIRRSGRNWLKFAGIGALLGLGYLAKAAMLPLSFVFLLSAFFLTRSAGTILRVAGLRMLLGAAVFAAIGLPFAMALSSQKGRLTFGDSGRIAYAEFVNRATRSVHWQGEPAGTGTPTHPTRKIFSDPAIYEFSVPVQGSYPPWYDPSYWYEGVRTPFALRTQSWAFFRAANMFLKIFSKSGTLWVIFAALWVFRRNALAWGSCAPGIWLVFLPSVAALAMYSVVLVEFRYVAPFALMLLLWVFARIRVVTNAEPRLLRRFQLVMILAPALTTTWAASRDLVEVIRNKPYEPWAVAQQLHRMGIAAGTEVAYIGTGLDAYWAHLGGVRIIAEIPDAEEPRFITADPARKQQALTMFSSAGARAVVTRNRDAANPGDGWRQIPGTHHFVWERSWMIAVSGKK